MTRAGTGKTYASAFAMRELGFKKVLFLVHRGHFVRKNKDDKISKEFYYLGYMTASGNTKEFTMPNTQKTAVEIEWILDVPVREDIYEYIVNL